MDSLLSHLEKAVKESPYLAVPHTRQLHLDALLSHSRRSHSMFPWATDIKSNKIRVQDLLVIASEDGVPTFALEANLYLFHPTNTKMLYISKVDTTGLSSLPSPAKTLTAAFVQWWLMQGPIRIHIFARAASQYLFPGSADNATKKALTDRQLTAWWKSVLGLTATSLPETQLRGWYAIPGCEEAETRRLLSSSATPANLKWAYGQGFDKLSSPLYTPPDAKTTIGDFIPSFPDDPKSRFLNSWASSRMNPSGETGDWDDAYHDSGMDDAQLVEQRQMERERLAGHPSVQDFWEHLAFRQECISGILVAFYAITNEDDAEKPEAKELDEAPALPHSVWVKLWSLFHNQDYTLIGDKEAQDKKAAEEQGKARIAKVFASWQKHNLEYLQTAHPKLEEPVLKRSYQRTIDIPVSTGEKRKAEEPAHQVNIMQLKPRKKAKPAPAPA